MQPGSLESEAGIFCAEFDKTGLRLITGEADKTIKIWKEDDEAVGFLFLLWTYCRVLLPRSFTVDTNQLISIITTTLDPRDSSLGLEAFVDAKALLSVSSKFLVN